MTDPLSALAERLASIDPARLDPDVAELARQRLFDQLATFNAGSYMPEGQLLRRVCHDDEIGPWQVPERDLLLLCGTIRSTEIDDIDILSCTTVGSVVAPAALVAARSARATPAGLALLGGVVAGYEAMVGFGRMVSGALRLGTGLWPTHLAAPIGAAAATASAFGCDAKTTAAALAIALNRTAGMGVRAAGPSSPRGLVAGAAAVDGYLAARAAAAGVSGDPEILAPLARRLGEPFDAELFVAPPGGWRIREVDTKPFRTARQAHSATDAFCRLLAGKSAGDVVAVDVTVPEQVLAMVNQTYPAGYERRLGMHYQFALAMLDEDALYDLTEAAHSQRERLEELMGKVRVEADQALTNRFPKQWGSAVTVRYGDGSSQSLEVLEPDGSAAVPPTWEWLERKHERVLKATTAGAGEAPAPGAVGELLLDCRTLGVAAGPEELLAALRVPTL